MKIATWNVERLKHRKNLDEIIAICKNLQADILVLTENDDTIQLDYDYECHSPTPSPLEAPGYPGPITYGSSEHRVSIYTKYKIIGQHETFDEHTALCLELETEKGNLLVYGTIMGVLGHRYSFQEDLEKQIEDFSRYIEEGYNLCICGDYNCSFSDNYFFTFKSRDLIIKTFSECGIQLLTDEIWQGIDHIAISNEFIGESPVLISEFHTEKRLSDHKGVSVEFD